MLAVCSRSLTVFFRQDVRKYFGRHAQQSAVHPPRVLTQTEKVQLIFLKQEEFQSGDTAVKQ